jgi:predicted AlkP superfamily phosphohydrolase/phosphomutase
MIYIIAILIGIVLGVVLKDTFVKKDEVKNVVTGEFPNIELGIHTNGVRRFLAYRRNGEWYGVVGYEEFKKVSDKVNELLAEKKKEEEEERLVEVSVREFIESVVLPKVMEAERTVVRKKRTPKKAKKVVKKK